MSHVGSQSDGKTGSALGLSCQKQVEDDECEKISYPTTFPGGKTGGTDKDDFTDHKPTGIEVASYKNDKVTDDAGDVILAPLVGIQNHNNMARDPLENISSGTHATMDGDHVLRVGLRVGEKTENTGDCDRAQTQVDERIDDILGQVGATGMSPAGADTEGPEPHYPSGLEVGSVSGVTVGSEGTAEAAGVAGDINNAELISRLDEAVDEKRRCHRLSLIHI